VLLRALQKCNWNQSQAARYLGLSRKTLIYRMHKHNLVERKPLCLTPGRSTATEIPWATGDSSQSDEIEERAS